MMDYFKKNKLIISTWVTIVGLLYIMTTLQVPVLVRNLFLVVGTALCMKYVWKKNSENQWELIILLLGLLARIVYSLLDVYAEFSLPIGGGDDGLAFMKTAIDYYHGDFSIEYTNYPYVLNAIFQITGINQYAAQYANVLCWAFTALLLQKACKRLEITGIWRLLTVAVVAWLPSNIWITSVLYRDTFVMLFLFASAYSLIVWIQDGKLIDILSSFGAVLAATWFHGGSIGHLVPIAVVVLFYSRSKHKFCFTKRNITFCLGAVGFVAILFSIPTTRIALTSKLPSMEGGIVEGLNRYLVSKYDYSEGAGSNYMEGRYLTGYFDILVMTVQRIYYHMFSPVPHMWRGIVDAAAFFLSSAPVYLITMILWGTSLCYKKTDVFRFVLFMENFVAIGIYAWGNVNGGTALRHREKILGLMMLLAIYSLSIIIKERKEKKHNEQIKSN